MIKEEFINEEIRPLSEFPDYGVTKSGKVYSFKKDEDGVELQPINHALDYDVINLSDPKSKYGKTTMLVHQLTMMGWGPPRPRPFCEFVITHQDRNKKNNHIDNLSWIRRSDVRANRSLPVRAINVDDPNDKILFRTTTDCAKYFHTNQSKIAEVCKASTPWKGYNFEYIEKPVHN